MSDLRGLAVAVAVLGPLLHSSGCGSNSAPKAERSGTTTSAIASDTLSTVDNYSVSVCRGSDPSSCLFRCSGTLVAPNLVLTVRHCITEAPPGTSCETDQFSSDPYPASEYWVSAAAAPTTPSGKAHRAARIDVPMCRALCGADIALIHLEDVVPPGEATPATPLLDPLDDWAKQNRGISVIGFGETRYGAGDFGTRRVLEGLSLQCISGSAIYPCSDEFVAESEFLVSKGGCDGDSGSGAFDSTSRRGGTALLVGTLSRGNATTDGCFRNVYIRADRWKNMIVKAATQAATRGAYPKPSWVVPVEQQALGAQCNAGDECASGSCESLDRGVRFVCSQVCGPSNACPDGFSCAKLPVVSGAASVDRCQRNAAPTPSSSSSGGCATVARVARQETPDGPPFLALFGVAIVLAARRLRPVSRSSSRSG